MNFLKSTLPFLTLGLTFIVLGITTSDPKPFSFGIVWLIIATAKHVLLARNHNTTGHIDH